MVESLRIFGLLLHKSWLVRKRHYIATLVGEILVPVALVALIWAVSSSYSPPPEAAKTDSHHRTQSLDELVNIATKYRKVPIFYSPNNNDFVNELMGKVDECFQSKTNITGFATEGEFIAYYYEHKLSTGVAVIFDEPIDASTKHLSYKLRNTGSTMPLYNEGSFYAWNLTDYYTQGDNLLQMQICLDRSFVDMKSGNKPIPDMYIQQMPYPTHEKQIPFQKEFRGILHTVLVYAFMFPLIIETVKAANEKLVGVNVLMAMNGISSTTNLLSWVISGFALLSVFCVIPILLLLTNSTGYGLPLVYYGNPLILFFVLMFYLSHLLAFGIHVSAYFSKALLVTITLVGLTVLVPILHSYAFTDSALYLAPYVGIIMPNILLLQVMEEISSYETLTEGIQWHNTFMNANPAVKVGGSVGMILILSIIGTILHFLLAIYVYAINPGKYGVGKHPLYFFKSKSKQNNGSRIESLNYDGINEYFESTPDGVFTPGIQIRNLKKAFNISLFSKQKTHALRGVSVDFYKGQITMLLGHNGAGKTTMMSIRTGMASATDGMVFINSKDLKENASELMNDMGLCTQENMYFSSLTVSEQLLFFAKLKNKDKSRSSLQQDVKALLQKLKLFDKKDALPNNLSGGQKRRLCLGMALVGDSSILILDEPTSGLDPESRRVIWDILLKMRGQKTILISTHDMEEADILGDRVAIMHTGQLKSYGTSMFLKRLIGQNNVEVICSIEPRSDPERIRRELHEDGVIISREASKIIVSVPNSPRLPDSLDNFEEKKKELGVPGFSVTLISLEQVFLKMTKENDDTPKPHRAIDRDEAKLTGTASYMQTVRALLSKKLTYTLKDYSTILTKVVTIFLALLTNALVLKGLLDTQSNEKLLPVNLEMYSKPEVLYTSYNNNFGDFYQNTSRSFGGNPIEVTNSSLDSALLQHAKENLISYDRHTIAAAEFNGSSVVNALYSSNATFSLPISVNLLWNTVVKSLAGDDYSISLFTQVLSYRNQYMDMSEIIAMGTSSIFAMIICLTIGVYVVHPHRESARSVKQLQKMTGVSGLTYWSTMFMFDLIDFIILSVVVVVGFVCVDLSLGLRLFGPNEIFIEILLLILFAINALPFVYIFSFFKLKTSNVARWAMCGPVGLVMVETNLQLIIKGVESLKDFRPIQKAVFLLVPYVSFEYGQMAFFKTAHTNARCHRLPNDFYDEWCMNPESEEICCHLNCYDGKCEKSKPFFDDADEDVSLVVSLIYLCVTPILYFGILAVVESQFVQKLLSKRAKHNVVESNVDEQVRQEKSMIFERIQVLSGNKPSSISNGSASNGTNHHAENSREDKVFLVYELQKSYKKLRAVKDVSFGVNRQECFGLLGVNGAGKSTTFRMMTGGEIADHGTMYLEDKDFKNNQKYFSSKMGYCPQHDAIIKLLNTYDHLRLFARLRGIPEDKVEIEIEAWIERLNLSACAAQPSGTYSGGNKRRLNIAMALIGNPNVILMDEPTTGVDPGARRSLWDVIKACQMAGQAVVLTSHSMDECEALCDRLAIMVAGKLVCIGASEELKQRFGAGYDIQIRMDPKKAEDQVDRIKNDVSMSLNCALTDQNVGYLMYHVTPNGTTWRKMYDVMYEMKSKYDCIVDFSVLSSSLEQLFLLFARAAISGSNMQPTTVL